jgi:hypothetical protein
MELGQRTDHCLRVTGQFPGAEVALRLVGLALRDAQREKREHNDWPDELDDPDQRRGCRVDHRRKCRTAQDEEVCDGADARHSPAVVVLEMRDLMGKNRDDLVRREQLEQRVAKGDAWLPQRRKREGVHHIGATEAISENLWRPIDDGRAGDDVVETELQIRTLKWRRAMQAEEELGVGELPDDECNRDDCADDQRALYWG